MTAAFFSDMSNMNKMIDKQLDILSWVILILAVWGQLAQANEETTELPTRLSFGRVLVDQEVKQTITFVNTTGQQLRVKNIQLTPPLTARKITSIIEPGGQGEFALVLGKERTFGEFAGLVRINFHNTDIDPVTFHIEGYVIPPIEFKPRPAFYVATHRGNNKQASIEITNHQTQPLNIVRAESQSERFSLKLETLSPGQMYRLTLLLHGDASVGKRTEPIRLITEPAMDKEIVIQANTFIRDRVYTFPESIDMGSLPFSVATDPLAIKRAAQTLMVYRLGTEDFDITASIDLDSVLLESERGPKGDRFQLTISLIPEKVRVGELEGNIRIKTNDNEITELVIPLTGTIFAE